MIKLGATLIIGFCLGISAIYWGQPWLNEVEHVRYTKTVTSVRSADYKKCEASRTDTIGTAGIQETLYECGRGVSFFVRAKENTYWVERKH